MTISEDDTGNLMITNGWSILTITEEDEAALLARLLDRAGGLQNLWVETVIQDEDRCRLVLLKTQTGARAQTRAT